MEIPRFSVCKLMLRIKKPRTHPKEEKIRLSVGVRGSKTSVLKLPIIALDPAWAGKGGCPTKFRTWRSHPEAQTFTLLNTMLDRKGNPFACLYCGNIALNSNATSYRSSDPRSHAFLVFQGFLQGPFLARNINGCWRLVRIAWTKYIWGKGVRSIIVRYCCCHKNREIEVRGSFFFDISLVHDFACPSAA